MDRAGIVYFARVFEYCHVTYEAMLADALDLNLEAFFQTSPWFMPLVHSEADYERPMRVSDRLVVSLEVERVGARSVTYAYRIEGHDEELRATAKLVHACVDREGFAPLAVPAELIEGLRRLDLVG